jgi:hypothetical protein
LRDDITSYMSIRIYPSNVRSISIKWMNEYQYKVNNIVFGFFCFLNLKIDLIIFFFNNYNKIWVLE